MTVDVSAYCVTFLSLLIIGQLMFNTSTVESAALYNRISAVSRPCPRNKYVAGYTNGTIRCSRCSHCPRGFQVQVKCSAYSNTICEPCPSGWYNDVRGSQCKPCSGCKLGEYIRRSCIATRDTKCRKCPRDTYSLSFNLTTCLRCKRCRHNEKIVSKCNRFRNTVCGNCFKDHFRESSTGSCLRCSPCPYKQQHLVVVPECRDKLGKRHSNICWPGETMVLFNSGDENYSYNSEITEKLLDVELEDYTYMRKYLTAIPIILGSILSCVVVFTSVYVFMHFTKCEQVWKLTRLVGFVNDIIIKIASVKSLENRADDCTQYEDYATVGTDSVKSTDGFNSDFKKDSESVSQIESLPLK
ncbi:uncharacterized protein LOC123556733 [Mercenaria mercenaria]|uniref:uncharacterized protein LOC123556733 n=1 Tax=Mercenaria mercenaria TaxID=6596 RepID=UPI00234F0CBA|nr:uncharacterized protein LOC123556733 [Mercenaria mercenaria]